MTAAAAAAEAGGVSLEPFAFWLPAAEGPLLPQVHLALDRQIGASGAQEVVRWAITAADPVRGLHLEGVLLRRG